MSMMQQAAAEQGPSMGQIPTGLTMNPVPSLLEILLGGAARAWLARLSFPTY